MLTPSAEASFGGKIKNIRIRERGSGSGYMVSANFDDPHTGETYDEEPQVTIHVYDAGADEDLVDPLASLELRDLELRSAAEHFVFDEQTFDGDLEGGGFSLSASVLSPRGVTLGTIEAFTVFPADENTQCDCGLGEGRLTEGGSVTLDYAADEARLSLGIMPAGGDAWQVVARLEGDASLAEVGVGGIEVQFNEPFEGPTPSENPVWLEGASAQTRAVNTRARYEWDFDGDGVADYAGPDLRVDDEEIDWCGGDYRLEAVTSDREGAELERDEVFCHIIDGTDAGYGDILINGEPIDIE